jgi:thiol-disulfide isomerase/thioredoxin
MKFRLSRRDAVLAGVAVAAGLAGVSVAWKRHALTSLSPDVMAALWAAEFDMPDGQVMKLSAFQGKPLVINFWATWCPPCVEEMPLLDAFYQQNLSKDWQVVGLAIDQPSRVRQFLNQHAVAYPVGLAGLNGTALGTQLGNAQGGLPFTVVLDAQGGLKERKLGKLSEDDIKSWVL